MRPAPPERRPRRWRRLIVLAASPFLGLLVAELGLRWLLFGSGELAQRWGRSWRQAGRYADARDQEEYWRLRVLFGEDPPSQRPPFHPVLGWIGARFDPVTLDPPGAENVGDRRPVLLYGASLAAGTTAEKARFQDLLEESELSDRLALVNYGVGGYGMDQALLLLRLTLDRWQGRDPIVVFAGGVEGDYDRALLGLRSWPKPRLVESDGHLEPAAPAVEDREAYVAQRGVGIVSYGWRYFVRAGPLPRSWRVWITDLRARERRCDHMATRLVEEFQGELEARGLAGLVLLMHGGDAAGRRSPSRRERTLVRACTRLGLPVVGTREALHAEAARRGGVVADLYYREGPHGGHPDEAGQRACFAVLETALATFLD